MALTWLHKKNMQQGVTLIEMIVVVAIIAMVSSVIIFNYSDFSSNVSLRNLTQDVALNIRRAQTYATSVRPIEALDGQSSRNFSGYGVSFGVGEYASSPADPMQKQFVLFADIPEYTGATPDKQYQEGQECGNPLPNSECIESIGINTADKIVAICTSNTPGYDLASDPTGTTCQATGQVDITFIRPNLDAYIFDRQANRDSSFAKIVFVSAKGLRHAVTVWNTGQISVQ